MENRKGNKKKLSKDDKILTKVVEIYASFYPKFFLLESMLIEKLIATLKKTLGNDWFSKQILNENSIEIIKEELEIIKKRKNKDVQITQNILFQEASFGFWVEFFNKNPYKSTKGCPIKIFNNLPKNLKRKEIYKNLYQIKELRNDIYHHRIPDIIMRTEKETFIKKLKGTELKIIIFLQLLEPSALKKINSNKFDKLILQLEKTMLF